MTGSASPVAALAGHHRRWRALRHRACRRWLDLRPAGALAGIGYGWIYAVSGAIGASVLAHTGLNLLHLLFFSYPALAPAARAVGSALGGLRASCALSSAPQNCKPP